MDKIFIFAGTKDGRVLAGLLSQIEKEVHIFVATEYGEEVLPKEDGLHIHQGRMDASEMADFFERERPDIVVDATHPFAIEVSANMKLACDRTKITYIRLLREKQQEMTVSYIVKMIRQTYE